jgi:hypothetical protein
MAPPLIFINTDNTNPKDKLYRAVKAGGAKAEEKMEKTVEKIIDKAPGFTTGSYDNAKGYTIRLTVASVDVGQHNVKCEISGAIEIYPPQATMKQGKGVEMLSTGMKGHAAADGTDERAILDCVEAITEDLTNKAIPIMKRDFNNRYGSSK